MDSDAVSVHPLQPCVSPRPMAHVYSQAHDYITDPLIASQPIDETGLNSHFTSTFAKHQPSVETAPAPDTLSNENNNLNRPHANDNTTHRHSRGASLGERYPGDMSHRPLDTLKQENKTAHRSPHLRKKQIPGVDMIDGLDSVPGGRYHHEGPFDATLLSRNLNVQNSPVAAVARSNRDALKATPREKIQDAVQRHMPLDGVAAYPPGESDEFGRVYSYEETNLMADQGKVQKISVDVSLIVFVRVVNY
jgi:hypothetical protein